MAALCVALSIAGGDGNRLMTCTDGSQRTKAEDETKPARGACSASLLVSHLMALCSPQECRSQGKGQCCALPSLSLATDRAKQRTDVARCFSGPAYAASTSAQTCCGSESVRHVSKIRAEGTYALHVHRWKADRVQFNLVTCQRCTLSGHYSCCGIPSDTPIDDWLCTMCTAWDRLRRTPHVRAVLPSGVCLLTSCV